MAELRATVAIFSDCVDQTYHGGHPKREFVTDILNTSFGLLWKGTPNSVMTYTSDALSSYCDEWSQSLLFCSYIPCDSPRARVVVKRNSSNSPRLSGWPLTLVTTCTHAIVFVHNRGYSQRIVPALMKRSGDIELHVVTVTDEQWCSAQ